MARFTAMDANLALKRNFAPWIQDMKIAIEDVQPGKARLRLPARPELMRAGDIICGQAIMALADTAMVFAIAATLGEYRPMATVTQTSNFLRPAGQGDLVAEARTLKSGRTLVFGEVTIANVGQSEPVAMVSSTYALAPVKPV
ncbi:MAG: PaaI family thioesterase [Alphaproteobacteria bacterium]|nr:PaaI family thioesterase [Alphaproteobacteria bacterium]